MIRIGILKYTKTVYARAKNFRHEIYFTMPMNYAITNSIIGQSKRTISFLRRVRAGLRIIFLLAENWLIVTKTWGKKTNNLSIFSNPLNMLLPVSYTHLTLPTKRIV